MKVNNNLKINTHILYYVLYIYVQRKVILKNVLLYIGILLLELKVNVLIK